MSDERFVEPNADTNPIPIIPQTPAVTPAPADRATESPREPVEQEVVAEETLVQPEDEFPFAVEDATTPEVAVPGDESDQDVLTVRQAKAELRTERRLARRRIRDARREARTTAKAEANAKASEVIDQAERAEKQALARLKHIEQTTSLTRQEQREEKHRLEAEAKDRAAQAKADEKAEQTRRKEERETKRQTQRQRKVASQGESKRAQARTDKAQVKAEELTLREAERKAAAIAKAQRKNGHRAGRIVTDAKPDAAQPKKLTRAQKRKIELDARIRQLSRVSSEAAGEMPDFGPPRYSLRWFFPTKPSRSEVAMSLRMLAFLMRELKGDLEPVTVQAENHAGTYLGDMYSRVAWRMSKENRPLVAAFEPETIIPPLVKSFMTVGGKAVSLPDRLEEASDLLVSAEAGTKDLVFSLLEPLATAIASLVMLVWISASVVPQQAEQYKSMDIPVPPVTAATIVIGQSIVWSAAIIGAITVGVVVWWFAFGQNSSRAREVIDRWKLGIPLYGPVARTSQGYHTSLFITALLNAGATELVALRETAAVTTNRSTRFQLYALADSLGDGQTTFADIADGVHMPSALRPVLAASVSGGRLLKGISNVRDQLADDFEFSSKRFRFTLTSLGTAVSLAIYVAAMLLMVLPTFEQATAFTNML